MRTAPPVLALLSAYSISFAQIGSGAPASPSEIKDKYHVALVDQFEVKEGLDFPAEYLKKLQLEISKQLTDTKIFEQVVQPGQQPAHPEMLVLRLAGTVQNYNQGNRAKRYAAGGFGAGAAEIDAQFTFIDAATGQQLLTQELRGVLTGGVFGGTEQRRLRSLPSKS
jgi:Domain of unknown function (DUF4410)